MAQAQVIAPKKAIAKGKKVSKVGNKEEGLAHEKKESKKFEAQEDASNSAHPMASKSMMAFHKQMYKK